MSQPRLSPEDHIVLSFSLLGLVGSVVLYPG